MNEVDERIREAMAAVDAEDRPPEFEGLWGRAEVRHAQNENSTRRRLPVLVPALGAAVLAAVLVVALLIPAALPEEAGTAGDLQPESLDWPALGSLPSDGLAGGRFRAGDVDQELLLAWNENALGSRTDWLLTLGIPRWDDQQERTNP